jgi:hypothetical protein
MMQEALLSDTRTLKYSEVHHIWPFSTRVTSGHRRLKVQWRKCLPESTSNQTKHIGHRGYI